MLIALPLRITTCKYNLARSFSLTRNPPRQGEYCPQSGPDRRPHSTRSLPLNPTLTTCYCQLALPKIVRVSYSRRSHRPCPSPSPSRTPSRTPNPIADPTARPRGRRKRDNRHPQRGAARIRILTPALALTLPCNYPSLCEPRLRPLF